MKRTLAVLLSAAMFLANTAMPVTTEGDLILGDVNGDVCVNARDSALILKEAAEIAAGGTGTFTEAQKRAADIDNNHEVRADDGDRILFAAVTNGVEPTQEAIYFSKPDSSTTRPPTTDVLPVTSRKGSSDINGSGVTDIMDVILLNKICSVYTK